MPGPGTRKKLQPARTIISDHPELHSSCSHKSESAFCRVPGKILKVGFSLQLKVILVSSNKSPKEGTKELTWL